MDYKIQDIEENFTGELVKNLGDNEYIIKINDREENLKILSMDSNGIEFVLGSQYHVVKYLEGSTAKMNLIVDGVPMQVRMHSGLDDIVYKNSGGAAGEDSEVTLYSQIPGKVVKIPLEEGAQVKKGDPIAVLESMKMQVAVKSHRDGTIKSIKVKQGGSVAKGDPIAEIE